MNEQELKEMRAISWVKGFVSGFFFTFAAFMITYAISSVKMAIDVIKILLQ